MRVVVRPRYVLGIALRYEVHLFIVSQTAKVGAHRHRVRRSARFSLSLEYRLDDQSTDQRS